ncbi:MAG TPA: hypothetical protein VMV72_08045 [Verrucomicrobiae bacterium]|nr:hypothetical protein [Verrucomicrobiae bacterium]
MKMDIPIDAATELPAEKKATDFKQSFWVRAAAFILAVAVGFLLARLVHAGFAALCTIGNGGQAKVSPLVAFWKALSSGLGD